MHVVVLLAQHLVVKMSLSQLCHGYLCTREKHKRWKDRKTYYYDWPHDYFLRSLEAACKGAVWSRRE